MQDQGASSPSGKKQPGRNQKLPLPMRLRRVLQYHALKLAKIRATPHQIALGLASGFFAAFLPILPAQFILSVILASLLGGNRGAAIIGTLISNPINTIPLHMLYYQIGKNLVPFPAPSFSFSQLATPDILSIGWQVYATLSLGALCLAIPTTIIGYFLAYKGVEVYRKRRQRRILRRQAQKEPTATTADKSVNSSETLSIMPKHSKSPSDTKK